MNPWDTAVCQGGLHSNPPVHGHRTPTADDDDLLLILNVYHRAGMDWLKKCNSWGTSDNPWGTLGTLGDPLVTMGERLNPWGAMLLMDLIHDCRIRHLGVHCSGWPNVS